MRYRARGLVNDSMIGKKGMKGELNEFKGIDGATNLGVNEY